MGSGAKSYMRKGFSIYEEMRKFFTIYEEVFTLLSFMTLHPIPLNFLMYEENFISFFISVHTLLLDGWRTGGLQSTYKYATGSKASCWFLFKKSCTIRVANFKEKNFGCGTRNRREFLLILSEFRLFHGRVNARNSVSKHFV
jgi:hypothetical protein